MKQLLRLFVLLFVQCIWYPLSSMEFLVQAGLEQIQEESPIIIKPVNNEAPTPAVQTNEDVSRVLALLLAQQDSQINRRDLLVRYNVFLSPHKLISKNAQLTCKFPGCGRTFTYQKGLENHKKHKHSGKNR